MRMETNRLSPRPVHRATRTSRRLRRPRVSSRMVSRREISSPGPTIPKWISRDTTSISSSANGVYTKLNMNGVLTTPTYTDTSAAGDVPSFYPITAVDTSGNESTFTASSAVRPVIGKNGTASDMKFDASGTLHFVWYDSAAKQMKYAT